MTHLAFINLLFEPGERLGLEEFLARWEQMPELKFAELIDGTVYMPSPVSAEHCEYDNQIQMLLAVYAARTLVCRASSNGTWLMADSAPQPDAALRLLPPFGGKTGLANGLLTGAPELIVEVCGSSRSFDLGPKLALYQRAGVSEYVAVLLEERRVEWRVLQEGSYRLAVADAQRVLHSSVFPGLWLDERAFWDGDSNRMLEVLEAGLASSECRSFIERLRGPAAG